MDALTLLFQMSRVASSQPVCLRRQILDHTTTPSSLCGRTCAQILVSAAARVSQAETAVCSPRSRAARLIVSLTSNGALCFLLITLRPRILRRSEEHTSELQSPYDLVCRLLLEK